MVFSNDTHNYCGIGHSWGSPHDPGDRADCRQVYLMNEFAQDDTEPTHRVRHCTHSTVSHTICSNSHRVAELVLEEY